MGTGGVTVTWAGMIRLRRQLRPTADGARRRLKGGRTLWIIAGIVVIAIAVGVAFHFTSHPVASHPVTTKPVSRTELTDDERHFLKIIDDGNAALIRTYLVSDDTNWKNIATLALQSVVAGERMQKDSTNTKEEVAFWNDFSDMLVKKGADVHAIYFATHICA